MIPKVIHWIWLGQNTVPRIFEQYLESWRRHHPAWEMRVWRDDNLPPLSCQVELDGIRAFKTRYDMLRLEVLRQFGGVILDMDVEAIRPIDPLLTGVSGFVGQIAGGHVGNQVLGAVPHHPFFERAVERARAGVAAGGTSSETAGKAFLKELLAEFPQGMTLFAPETFHFQPSFEPPKRPDDFPGVYAVHHELASYAALATEAELLDAVSALMQAVSAAHSAPDDPEAQARLRKRELQLRRAISRQERGYAALQKRLEAEREHVEARLNEMKRTFNYD